jgi:hypothetical protein
MIGPDATAIQLVIEAATDPIAVLRICQGRLVAAPDLAVLEFDEHKAAEGVREISAVLKAVADAMLAHSQANPYRRPGRKQIAAAKAALVEDAESGSWGSI